MRARVLVVCLGLVLVSRGAAAQGGSQAPPQGPVVAGFDNGFFVQSSDGEYRVGLGLVAQLDGRFSLDDPTPFIDTFALRKLRPTLIGRLTRYFEFKVMPDFGNGTTVVQDAFLDVRFGRPFRVRTGKDKTPVGYELLQGDAFVLFPERALASSLVPNRDMGVQAQGDINSQVSYAAGVFNGVPDGASSSSDVDANNGKDLAGRIDLLPFRHANTTTALSGLGVHLGGSTGREAGALPTFRTSAGQMYFSYAAGVVADGDRTRVSPALFYYYKAFGAFGEYMRSTQHVARSAVARDVTNTAWEVTGSYVLTGETASDRGVRPRDAFDPQAHHWGALQILARRSHLDVDQAAFDAGLAAPDSSRRAHQTSVGLNWYPTAFVKWYAMYEHTEFHGGTSARPPENVVIFRGQVAF